MGIKQGSDSFLGIPSQCISVENSRLTQPNVTSNFTDQYCTNLAMKINVKLGGVNVAPVSYPAWQDKPFMVLGEPSLVQCTQLVLDCI